MPEWLGKTIGKVRIEKLLARGGMAEVYLGSHLTLERPVAIKVLHSFVEEDPTLLERFRREAKVVAGLRHPNIVQVFDFDTIDGHPYIVMEYLSGPTLANYLRHLHQRKKRIPVDQVARLLNELSTALDYAHGQGVVHRDIKPGNIMLYNKTGDVSMDGPLTDDIEAIITDFGLVRIMNAATQTASGMVSGTPAYMSPEQARGDQIDHRTDIYSLGIVLYEMMAGRVPFQGDNTLTVLHMQIHTPPPPIVGILPEVQAILERALKKNPDDRYQSTRELAIDYSRAAGITPSLGVNRETYPATTPPLDVAGPTALEPIIVSEPVRKTEQIVEREPEKQPEPPMEPQRPPEPAPKPARSRSWIGIGLLSLVCLGLLAFGAFRLLSAGRGLVSANPTETVETVSPALPTDTATSPPASEAPALPPATNMVQIPAGAYQVGKDPANANFVAPQTVDLTSFWIDQYETTNAEYQEFIDATAASTPAAWPPPAGQERFPVRGVGWDQANAYCQWRTKRLPAEAEWEAAGRGNEEDPPRLYPWGDLTFELSQQLNDLYEVGTLSFNVSPLGVHDLVGNVWEWVGEPYVPVQADGYRVLHGGRYGFPQELAYRVEVSPDDPAYPQYFENAGFRCAADQVR